MQYSQGGKQPPQQSFQKENEGQNVFKEILPLNLMGDKSRSLSSPASPLFLCLLLSVSFSLSYFFFFAHVAAFLELHSALVYICTFRGNLQQSSKQHAAGLPQQKAQKTSI